MKQIFYDPKTGQVMAEYRNCKYGGTVWQDMGYVEAECEDDSVTRDHKVTVEGGNVASKRSFTNPEQPKIEIEPSIEDILIEAGAVTRGKIEEARARLKN